MRESEPKTLSAAMRKAMHSETTYSLIKGRAENRRPRQIRTASSESSSTSGKKTDRPKRRNNKRKPPDQRRNKTTNDQPNKSKRKEVQKRAQVCELCSITREPD